jgi:hypothetical protein
MGHLLSFCKVAYPKYHPTKSPKPQIGDIEMRKGSQIGLCYVVQENLVSRQTEKKAKRGFQEEIALINPLRS